METHYLKLVQPLYSDVLSGDKNFELRRNDRDYQVGDLVILQEYDMKKHFFSGREIRVKITYILENRAGLDNDFCIFSFIKILTECGK